MDNPFELNTNNALCPGQVFLERYTLVKFLGRGGMGQVWLVKDSLLGEEIALKFLPSEIMMDRAALEDLKRETLRSRKLSHPHIIKVYDFATAHNSGAISMEYAAGGTLADVRYDLPGMIMDARDPGFIRWMIQLAEALTYAHETAGIVHRDLKPQNLMLDGQGNLKLTDFGVARSLTDSMSRLSRQNAGSSGTHIYMSPQQAQGRSPSASDDIYAFGATVYDLLTSKPPFFRGNIQHQIDSLEPDPMNQRRAELVEDTELPAIPQYWEDMVAACLKKLPEQRPATMREIGDYLVSWSQQPIQMGPPSISGEAMKTAENARLAEEAHSRDESERKEKERQIAEAHRIRQQEVARNQAAELQRRRELQTEQESPIVSGTSSKVSRLPWILATCVVLGWMAWGMVSSNKAHQASTLSVTDDAAIQREQEKQVLAAQAKSREHSVKQEAESQRLANLSKTEKLAPIAQAKAKEGAELETAANLSHNDPTVPANPPVVSTKVATPETTSLTKAKAPGAELVIGYLDAALREVKDIRDPSQVIEALCEIAVAKSRVGEVEASRAIFAQVKKWASTLPTVFTQDSVVALGRIAQSEGHAGDREAARNTLKGAVAKLAENDEIFSRSMAMSRIGEAQLIIGDVKDGLITFEQADKTASKLKGHSKNWCLIENSIIRSQAEAQSGNGESARKTLVDAIVFADTPRADLLARIAQSQAKIGDVDGSKKTFIKSLDLAIRMKDTYEKGSNLKDLATAQAKSGDIVGANSTASKISERYEGGKYAYKEEAIAAIGNATSALARNQWMLGIQQQTKDGGVITAESEVKKLTSAEDRCRGYIQIAFGLLGK